MEVEVEDAVKDADKDEDEESSYLCSISSYTGN
jgi:hypothetical protein